jgi:hypothetical protein
MLLATPALALRRSRQILKDPQIRLVGVSLIGAGVGKLAVFAAFTVLAWASPVPTFAVFAAQWLAVQSIAGIFTSSAANATASHSARGAQVWPHVDTRDLRLPARLAMRGGLVGALALAPAAHLLTGDAWNLQLLPLGLGIGAIVYLDGLLGVLAGKGMSRRIAVAEASRGLLALPTAFILATMAGPTAAVAGLITVDAAVAVALSAPAVRQFPPTSVPTAMPIAHNPTSEPMRIARVGTFANLITQTGLYGFNAILSHGYGIAALAAFSVANRFASLAILLPTLLTKNMLGLLTRSAAEDGEQHYARALRRYIVHVITLATLAGGAAVLTSFTLFGGLFTKYPLAAPLLVIIVVSSIPSAIGSALGVACIVRGHLGTWIASDLAFTTILVMWALAATKLSGSAALVAVGMLAAYAISTSLRAWRVLKG